MKENRNEEMEIDLIELFFHLLKRWKLLLLGLVVGAVLAGGATYIKTPIYQSSSMLYLVSSTSSSISSILSELQVSSTMSSDFVVIATSKPVIDTAIETIKEDSGVTLTREQVQSMLTVTNDEDTHILTITVKGEEPQVVCDLANAVTEAVAAQMSYITKTDPPTTIETAEVAGEPLDNGMKQNTAKGAVVGFVIVAILLIIPFLLNDRIKGTEDVEKYLNTEVLGVIPLDKSQQYKDRHRKRGPDH